MSSLHSIVNDEDKQIPKHRYTLLKRKVVNDTSVFS